MVWTDTSERGLKKISVISFSQYNALCTFFGHPLFLNTQQYYIFINTLRIYKYVAYRKKCVRQRYSNLSPLSTPRQSIPAPARKTITYVNTLGFTMSAKARNATPALKSERIMVPANLRGLNGSSLSNQPSTPEAMPPKRAIRSIIIWTSMSGEYSDAPFINFTLPETH